MAHAGEADRWVYEVRWPASPSSKLFLNVFYFCVYEYFTCMHVHHVHSWCLQKAEEGIGFPGTGVAEDYELLHGCRELDLASLQGQLWLLTAELSLSRPAVGPS